MWYTQNQNIFGCFFTSLNTKNSRPVFQFVLSLCAAGQVNGASAAAEEAAGGGGGGEFTYKCPAQETAARA